MGPVRRATGGGKPLPYKSSAACLTPSRNTNTVAPTVGEGFTPFRITNTVAPTVGEGFTPSRNTNTVAPTVGEGFTPSRNTNTVAPRQGGVCLLAVAHASVAWPTRWPPPKPPA
jgi:hypothetical protein